MFSNMDKGLFRAFGTPVVNIYLNEQKIDDWISFKADLNGMGNVDSFEFTTQWDIEDKPRNELFYSGSQTAAALVKEKAVVKIEAGFEGEEVKCLIEGDMDSIEWNFKIEVVSWQSGDKKSKGSRIIETAHVGELEGENIYTIRRYIPNITRQQAQKAAENIKRALEQQQFSGSFNSDYFAEMTNDRRIVLYGVGVGLSQIYHVNHITIDGSKDKGLQCALEFTNIFEK